MNVWSDKSVDYSRSSRHARAAGRVADGCTIILLFVENSNKIPQVAVMLNN